MTNSQDTLRVCLYSGLDISADAISSSLRLKMQVIDELADGGLPFEVCAFVQGSDDPDWRVVTTPTAFDVLSHPAYGSADAHVFEFGIAYDLFDLVFLACRIAPTAATYHNVTPADLVDEGSRGTIERSMRQRYNLFAVDHVACVSELNRRDLLALGMPEDRLSVVPLPPTVVADRPQTRFADRGPGPLRILYVGRLVKAKGILDLLDALTDALGQTADLRLTIVGNEELSDPPVVTEVRRRIVEAPLAGHVEVLGRLDDVALARIYGDCDVLVMPSYHEGYCLPVVEAHGAGAYVVAYDTANLPFILAGHGSLVPTGDSAALASVLVDLAARFRTARERDEDVVLPTSTGEVGEAAWRAAVAAYVADHSRPVFRRRFAGLLAHLAARRPQGPPPWLPELEAVAEPVLS